MVHHPTEQGGHKTEYISLHYITMYIYIYICIGNCMYITYNSVSGLKMGYGHVLKKAVLPRG